MATLNNFTITSAQNQDILIYSNGSWINSNISGFFGILDGRYSANTHNHDGRYILKADAYTKSQTYPAASLYTKAEIDAMFSGYDGGGGSGGGGGLVNSASNVGSGAGVFHANSSGDLQFRSLFSQDIDLLTIAVSGTSVVFTPKVPTWSKLVSANGQLTTSHVNFANQGLNTSSKPSFAGLTVDTGSWSSSGLKLTGAAPSIYFSQDDNSNAYVGLNTNYFYVLQDTNSDGNFESPYALRANLDGSSFRYYGNEVYHTGNKPSWNEIAGKPAISTEGHTHNSIEVQDQRTMPGSDGSTSYLPNPRDIESHALSTYFGYYNNTGGGWKSSITVKGWNEDYSVWQLIGGASTGQDNMLYFRTGRADSWDTPYAIYHEGHKPSFSEITGEIGASQLPSRLADFSDGNMNAGMTFSGRVYLDYVGNISWKDPNSDGSVGLSIANDSTWLRYRFGGTSNLDGVEISNYDTTGIRLHRTGWAEFHNNNGIAIRSGTNGAGAKITFSDEVDAADPQTGTVEYFYADGAAGAGYNEGFVVSGTEAKLIFNVQGDIKANILRLGDSLELESNNGRMLEVRGPSGYVRMGANNSSYGHFYTDSSNFYMNTTLQVDGALKVYGTFSQFTEDGGQLYIGPTGNAYTRVQYNGDIFKRNADWSNNPNAVRLLMNSFNGNIGDYIKLQASGNRTDNGALVISRDVFSVGRDTHDGIAGSTLEPFAVDTWMTVGSSIFALSGKEVFKHSDGWLRFNESGDFDQGIYCANSILRTDGNLQVGNSGNAFNANTSQIDLKVTTRVHNKLHVREIVSQDGNYTSIGAGELGNSLYEYVNTTYGAGNEGVHIGGEHGVYLYSHSNNMTGGMDASYSIRVLASDGASYLNHLDVYKSQNNSNQVMARFRHPIHNGSIALVSKNNDAGSFRFEANMEGQDLRIQTCDTSGNYFTSGISVGTIARFFRDGDVSIAREVTAQDFIATSDIRVKENLERIDSSLDKVAKLAGYTYDQINLKQRKAGLIAQDVKEVLPEAVGEDGEGMLNVSPMAVLALLVNAVNDLAKEVKELKNGN